MVRGGRGGTPCARWLPWRTHYDFEWGAWGGTKRMEPWPEREGRTVWRWSAGKTVAISSLFASLKAQALSLKAHSVQDLELEVYNNSPLSESTGFTFLSKRVLSSYLTLTLTLTLFVLFWKACVKLEWADQTLKPVIHSSFSLVNCRSLLQPCSEASVNFWARFQPCLYLKPLPSQKIRYKNILSFDMNGKETQKKSQLVAFSSSLFSRCIAYGNKMG